MPCCTVIDHGHITKGALECTNNAFTTAGTTGSEADSRYPASSNFVLKASSSKDWSSSTSSKGCLTHEPLHCITHFQRAPLASLKRFGKEMLRTGTSRLLKARATPARPPEFSTAMTSMPSFTSISAREAKSPSATPIATVIPRRPASAACAAMAMSFGPLLPTVYRGTKTYSPPTLSTACFHRFELVLPGGVKILVSFTFP
mmetsp:Transcript_82233/g.172160  ORF Transcript_82233/g.172160 Transcript_82233/m.172160 type:complete len:202 (-) Transcript_82233:678-1283(-)